jgi:hypothetical protein
MPDMIVLTPWGILGAIEFLDLMEGDSTSPEERDEMWQWYEAHRGCWDLPW